MNASPTTNTAVLHKRQARKRLLDALYYARTGDGQGWMTGTMLLDCADAETGDAQRIDSPRDALRLLGDLVRRGYIQQRGHGRRPRGPRASLDKLRYRITGQGSYLWLRIAPPDPAVDEDWLGV